MEKRLQTLPSLQIPPAHLRSFKIYKVLPLGMGLLHRAPSCQLRAKSSSRGAVEIQWRKPMGTSTCAPRFVCLFGGADGKGKQGADGTAQGAARKALEKALGGKRSAFSKWEETQKREADVGGGGRGGRGWFGGGGWEGFFNSGDDENDWEETLQVTCAALALFFLYGMIIAPQKLTHFISHTTVNSVVYLLNCVLYYSWWLRMKASGRRIVKSESYYGSRSPEPYQPYDDMGEWDED